MDSLTISELKELQRYLTPPEIAEIERLLIAQAKKANWRDIARPEQLRPDDCSIFVVRGGRSSGKTRTGAEDFLERARSGDTHRLHMLAPTFDDGCDIMVEGDSGILSCAKPGEIEKWNRSKGEVYFASGVFAKVFSAREPDRLNGPQCGHLWCDEFWACSKEAIDQAEFGLRLGRFATSTFTSTPKTTPSTRYVLAMAGAVIRRLRLRDNAANLAPGTIERWEQKYAGTRLAKVELEGETLEDVEGALWKREWFNQHGFRIGAGNRRDIKLVRIAVSLDPTTEDPELKKNPLKEMDECGIIAAGVDEYGNGYVLKDWSARLSPADWARRGVKLYTKLGANFIVAEKNQGGQMVGEMIRNVGPGVPFELVFSKIGKRARAEPISLLYEQGRIFHCGEFPQLEDEMTNWDAANPASRSPNRIDALCQCFVALGLCEMQSFAPEDRLVVNHLA